MFQYNIELKKVEEYLKMYEDTINAKRNPENKEKLKAICEKVKNRYKEYLNNKNCLETIVQDAECCKLQKQLNDCYEKNERVVRELNEIIKKQKLEIQHLCPLCELNRYSEKDHYLPKKQFPEYSIFMPNIIPACNDCNKKKSERITDNDCNRLFLNAYFDKFPTTEILKANVDFSEEVPYAKFYLSKENMKCTLTQSEINIIENHFKNLDLLNRYERASASEIAKRINNINSQTSQIDKDVIKSIYQKNLDRNIKIYGINYWENVLDRELVENKFDELFDFANKYIEV